MRVLIHRIAASSVTVEGQTVGAISRGLNLLVDISATDTEAEIAWTAQKCLNLRLFPQPPDGRFDGRKGRRPSFAKAASPQQAEQLYDKFIELPKESGLKVETGQFGANMQVSIKNDRPVTLWLDRDAV